MADFESDLAGMLRASANAAEPQRLVEPIMRRIDIETRRRAFLVGAFALGGVAMSAVMLLKVISLGRWLPDVRMPALTAPATFDPLYLGALVTILILAAGSGAVWRLSREL